MIVDISIEYLTTSTLKEDISHYRNIMQHVKVDPILESIQRLRDKAEHRVEDIMKKVD